jgi:hypothetical protein
MILINGRTVPAFWADHTTYYCHNCLNEVKMEPKDFSRWYSGVCEQCKIQYLLNENGSTSYKIGSYEYVPEE